MNQKALLFILLLCCASLLSAQSYQYDKSLNLGKAPKGITLKDNSLYVALSGDNKIVKTSLDGTVLLTIDGLSSPFDVDCDSSGRIYVANRGGKNLQVFSADGTEIKTISFTEAVNGVTVGKDDKIFVATVTAVHIYTSGLELEQQITSLSTDKFREIRKVYFDANDNMYLVDKNTGTLKLTSYANGKGQVAYLIKKENGVGVYNRLAGITSTGKGDLIISADEDVMGLYRFTSAGVFIDNIGTKGTGGSFNKPYGLATDEDNNLYIADSGTNTIQIWKADDLEAPVCSMLQLRNLTRSGLDLLIQADEICTAYWLLQSASETPDAETVKQTAQGHFSLAANSLEKHTLTVGKVTDKKICLVLEDVKGNLSEVIATETFGTDMPLNISRLFVLSKTEDSATLELIPNDSGTLYYMVADSPVNPSTSDIINGVGALSHGKQENVTAGALHHIRINELASKRYYFYAFLQQNAENSTIVNHALMPATAAETIYQRYFSLLTGENVDYSSPTMSLRYQAIRATVEKARQKLPEYQWEEGLEPFDLSSKNTTSSTQLRDILGNVLLPLALSYHLEGSVSAPNPDYRDMRTLQEILDLYDYLEKRGFVSGSALEFNTSGPYLGLAGYFYSAILMREELLRNGRWDVVGENMKWASRMVSPDNTEWGAEVEHNGSRSDGVRTIYHNRLVTLACMTDNELTREDDLAYLSRALNQNMKIAPAWDGFIKPDFTGYHHYGVWGNAYNIDALHTSCQMAMLLKDTPYALTNESVNNLANSLLAFRQYSGKYDIPRGICGRFPNQLNTLLNHIPAFAFLYEVLENDLKERIGGAFCRLYTPEYSEVQQNTICDVTSNITFHGGIGALQKMDVLKAKDLSDTEVSESNRTYPYAAMQVHRRNDWMVAVKGYTKYVWDFETNGEQNWLGRNQSAGELSLYATADKEGVVGSKASGLGYNGWDWVHVPGATVFDMSLDEVVNEAKAFEWAKFSPQYFAGGVSLEGKDGLYGMIYNDIRQAYDYDNGRKWLGVKLSANKSYFFFDDEVVALGSAIKNTHDKFDAHTTLFQNELADISVPLYINGEAKSGLGLSYVASDAAPCYLTDAVGNGYVLPDATGLHIQRSAQTSKADRNYNTVTTGNYAKAWLDHGKSADGAYHYLIYVGGAAKVKEMSGTPVLPYVVQKQDNTAHIVYHPQKNLKGYAIFNATGSLNDNYIASASEPCLAMLKEVSKEEITLSVSNPELGFYAKDKFPYQVWSIDKDKLFLPSEVQGVDISLNGEWELKSTTDKVELINYDKVNDITLLRFSGKDAESVEVRLQNNTLTGIGNIETQGFSCYPNPFDDYLILNISENTGIPCLVELYDVMGRLAYSGFSSGGKLSLPASSLAKGIYVLKIDGKAASTKLIKQ